MKPLRLKLEKGSDIKLSLENLCKTSNINGFVLGVVGDLSVAVFQCPKRKEKTFLEGNLEIITLNGSLSPSSVHLHLSVSDTNCQVWGGHLENGSIALKGVDILIGDLTEFKSDLVPDKLSPQRVSLPRLEIATLPNCPWSARIKRTLNSSEILYEEISVEDDANFQLIQGQSGSRTFPQVFLDGKYVGGYTEFLSLYSSGQLSDIQSTR